MSGGERFADGGERGERGERLVSGGERGERRARGERLAGGGDPAERLAGGGDRLERAYGRLLRWYPAGHQARHGDEMLGVLMAGPGAGRGRPGLADSANLIGGALRIRVRKVTAGSVGLWREALARAGIVLPLAWVMLMLTFAAPGIARDWTQTGLAGTLLNPSVLTSYAQDYLPALVVLITVLLGWRRVALAAIAAAVIVGPGDSELHYLSALQPYDAVYLAVLGVAAVALVAAPTRARAWLKWRHCLLAAAAALAGGVAAYRVQSLLSTLFYSSHGAVPTGWPGAELAGLGIVAAVTVILLAGSAVSRRLLVIAAVPLYFYVAFIVTTPFSQGPSPLIDLPLAALAGAAILLAARQARTRRQTATNGSA